MFSVINISVYMYLQLTDFFLCLRINIWVENCNVFKASFIHKNTTKLLPHLTTYFNM